MFFFAAEKKQIITSSGPENWKTDKNPMDFQQDTIPLEVRPPFFVGWFPSFTIILVGGENHLPKGTTMVVDFQGYMKFNGRTITLKQKWLALGFLKIATMNKILRVFDWKCIFFQSTFSVCFLVPNNPTVFGKSASSSWIPETPPFCRPEIQRDLAGRDIPTCTAQCQWMCRDRKTSVATSKFSCPTFRVFPGKPSWKQHITSTLSTPAPLFNTLSLIKQNRETWKSHSEVETWSHLFCGEKNLLLTFLADFPSYSPFFKKKLPFCPLSCGFKSPPKFNSPFLHKELQLTHPKFQFRRRHLKPKEADFRVFRPEVRPPGSGDYISVNGIFFGWICKVSGEFIHEWNEQKEYLEPGLYTPQKRKDIHRSVFGIYIYICFLVFGSAPIHDSSTQISSSFTKNTVN